jgi:hypothetical protein
MSRAAAACLLQPPSWACWLLSTLEPAIEHREFLVGLAHLGRQALVLVGHALLAEGLLHAHATSSSQGLVRPVDGAFVDGIGDGLQLGVARQHQAHGVG